MVPKAKLAEYYQALIEKNPKYEGIFYVGVKTTGIFCRSVCTANKPKFENCEFFSTAKETLYASYRCCKICKPLSHTDLVSPSISKLVEAIEEKPDKHWKTYDFQIAHPDALKNEKQFTDRFNMTFIEYARARRIGLAMKHIRTEHATCHGLPDAFSEFMDLPSKYTEHSLKAAWLPTELGPMLAVADDKGLYVLEFVDRRALETEIRDLRKKTNAAIFPGKNKIIEEVEKQLIEYFDARRSKFDIPLHLIGSPFQKSVWDELRKIPIGEIRAYSDIAQSLNKPKASRAVGTANGKNQLAIIIPCHRVINTGGDLGGYGGGLDRKEKLLQLEKKIAICIQAKDKKRKTSPFFDTLSQPIKKNKLDTSNTLQMSTQSSKQKPLLKQLKLV